MLYCARDRRIKWHSFVKCFEDLYVNDLGYVRSRWVPHLLTDEQKQSRFRLASQVIDRKYDKCDPRHLEEIVTGDETWIYHFQLNYWARSKVWVTSEGDRPVIARRCKTSNLMLYATFFDSKGPVLQIPVQKGSSVTGKFYRESVLTQLVDFYQKRRPCTGVRGIKILHDNAPAINPLRYRNI